MQMFAFLIDCKYLGIHSGVSICVKVNFKLIFSLALDQLGIFITSIWGGMGRSAKN